MSGGVTVIDKLIMELGLDPTEFRKGTKEVDKSLANTTAGVKKNSTAMGTSIANMARNFAVAFLGWKGVQGFLNLNHTASQMGYLAANTGQAVEKVNALGEAMRLSGGESSDAAAALQKVSAEQTSLRTTGNSGWLENLQRLRVNLLNADGTAKDTYQTLLSLSDAFGGLSRPDAFNIGAGMGLNENQMNFLLQGRKAIEDQVAVQLKQYKLTKAEADAARQTEKSLENLKLKGEHVFRALLTQMRPFIDELATWLGGIQIKPEAVQMGVDALKALGKGIEFFVDVVKLAVRGWSEIMDTGFGKAMTEMFGAMAKEVHEFANNKTPKAGEPMGPLKFFFGGGLFDKDPSDPSVTNLGAWLGSGVEDSNRQREQELRAKDPASLYGAQKDFLRQREQERAAMSAASAAGSGSTTVVHIEHMEINTSEKYAPGIAKGMSDAIKGKVNFVNQSTTGQR